MAFRKQFTVSERPSEIAAYAWTETLFLNHTKHNPPKVGPKPSPAVRDTDGSSLLTTTADSPLQKRKRSPSTVGPDASTRNKKKYKICNHSKSSKHNKPAPSELSDENTASNNSHQLAAKGSVVWDIESSVKGVTEETQDGMRNETCAISSPSSHQGETLILNTRVTTWSTENPSIVGRHRSHLEPDHEGTGRLSSPPDQKETDRMLDGSFVSHSSLCPSQSASQAIPIYNKSHIVQQTTRSKYFMDPRAPDDCDGAGVQALPGEGMEVETQKYRPTTDEENSLRYSRGSPARSLSTHAPRDLLVDVDHLPSDIRERVQDTNNDLHWDERNSANHCNFPPLTVDPCMDFEYWQANGDRENSFYCGSSHLDMCEAEDLLSAPFETQTDCDLDLENDYFYEPSVDWIDPGYQGGGLSDRNEAALYHSDFYYPANQAFAYEDHCVESNAMFAPDDDAGVSMLDDEHDEAELFGRHDQSSAYPYLLEQPCLHEYSPDGSTDSAPIEIDSATGHLEVCR